MHDVDELGEQLLVARPVARDDEEQGALHEQRQDVHDDRHRAPVPLRDATTRSQAQSVASRHKHLPSMIPTSALDANLR